MINTEINKLIRTDECQIQSKQGSENRRKGERKMFYSLFVRLFSRFTFFTVAILEHYRREFLVEEVDPNVYSLYAKH